METKNILDLFKLDGKVALVTGAARGLGQAIATALASAGADVIAGRYSCQPETCRYRKNGTKASGLSANLMEKDSIAPLIVSALKELGQIDILVNNAGIIRRAQLTISAKMTGTTSSISIRKPSFSAAKRSPKR
jgi:2-deoxy-D-gluconate 3-dehydrogenase